MPAAPDTSLRRPIRPLLKWPGGKRQLLPAFRRFYPSHVSRYVEPFVGSGAVFFDLCESGRLEGVPVLLADRNADLIGCYGAVRDTPEAVVAALGTLARRHAAKGSACYYAVREAFNETRARLGPDGTGYTPELAAMLIYLNRTGFNGLFRLNARGQFNVPAGRYARPRICDPGQIHAVASVLRWPTVALRHCGFEQAAAGARAGDFFYFDPPYAPLSPTSAFGSYTATRFSEADQERLCDLVVDLAARGCLVMLSNSSADRIARTYRAAARSGRTGLALWQVPARRAISAVAASRGPVPELLLTNLVPRGATDGLTRVA